MISRKEVKTIRVNSILNKAEEEVEEEVEEVVGMEGTRTNKTITSRINIQAIKNKAEAEAEAEAEALVEEIR